MCQNSSWYQQYSLPLSHSYPTYYTADMCALNVFFPDKRAHRKLWYTHRKYSRNMTTTACCKTAGAFPLLPLLLLFLCSQTMVAAFHVHHNLRVIPAPSSTFTPDSSSLPLGGRPARADTHLSMGFSLFSFGQKKASLLCRSLCGGAMQ